MLRFIVLALALVAVANAKMCKGSVHYRVTFKGLWNGKRTVRDYPKGAHWSPVVMFSHTKNFHVHRKNRMARPGVKELAETGATSKFLNYLQSQKNAGKAVVANGLDSPGQSSSIIMASKHRRFASAMSMMAPSPDWIAAVRVSLCDTKTGKWKTKLRKDAKVLDVGTDDGRSFKSKNKPRAVYDKTRVIDENFGNKNSPFYNPGTPMPVQARVLFELLPKEN